MLLQQRSIFKTYDSGWCFHRACQIYLFPYPSVNGTVKKIEILIAPINFLLKYLKLWKDKDFQKTKIALPCCSILTLRLWVGGFLSPSQWCHPVFGELPYFPVSQNLLQKLLSSLLSPFICWSLFWNNFHFSPLVKT